MSKINYGDVPDYILPYELFSKPNNSHLLDNYIGELCCDEYIDYLKLIPKSYTSCHINTLLSYCVKNDSIICTQYILESANVKLSTYIKLLFRSSIRTNKPKYFNWLFTQSEINLLNENDIDCDILVKTKNTVMLLKILSLIDCKHSILLSIFQFSCSNGNLIFCEILYEMMVQKNVPDLKSKLKEYFLTINISYDIYIWLYDILKDNLSSNELFKLFTTKLKYELSIIQHLESIISVSKENYDILLNITINPASNRFSNNTLTDEDDKLFTKLIIYLYSKCEYTHEEKLKLFEIVKKKYKMFRSKYLKEFGHYLIDDSDIEIDDFKDKFYEYSNYKKTLVNKKYRLGYINKNFTYY